MKTTLPLAALAALALSGTAKADRICTHCEQSVQGTYLGGYWPGDRGTFHRSTPTVAVNGVVADDYYVIDVYQQGTITLAVGSVLPVWL